MRLDWEPLREHVLTTGVVRHACRLRRDGTRRFLFWGILLRLDWEPLRERTLDHRSGQPRKVARGRSWQPEIGMEHASRGRRSGNKGVGARWRGRFRIFSARHCSRTKVSHAENSGMTMLFFSLEVAPVSEGDSFTRSGAAAPGIKGVGRFVRKNGVLRIIRAISTHPLTHSSTIPRERQHQELRGWGVLCGKMEFCAIIRAISTHPPTPPTPPPSISGVEGKK